MNPNKIDICTLLDLKYLGITQHQRRKTSCYEFYPFVIEGILEYTHNGYQYKLEALQVNHLGQTHFDIEKVGTPSRWNTLRALRVLQHFNINPIA